jgi:hypothetical protein
MFKSKTVYLNYFVGPLRPILKLFKNVVIFLGIKKVKGKAVPVTGREGP